MSHDNVSLTKYYESICKQPILTREEERRLFDIIYDKTGSFSERQKKLASDKLIGANLRFVFKKAKQYSKGDIDQFQELISAGNEGLVVSLEKFDPKSGVRFLTYAGWWVIQRQLKEMSRMRIVSLPIWKQQLAKRITNRENELGRPMTDQELSAEFPEFKLKDLKDLSKTKYLTYYIDDFLTEDGFHTEDGLIKDLGSELVEFLDNEDMQLAINALPSPMKEVLELSFGLDDGKEKSVSKVASELNLRTDEVKRLRTEAIIRLRRTIHQE